MARDQVTGVILRQDALEWATLRKTREGYSKGTSGRVSLEAPAADVPPPDGPSVAGEAEADIIRASRGRLAGDIVPGLPSECLLLRVMDLPVVEPDEMTGMVQLQFDKISPFPVESMVVSHEILATRGETAHVAIVAARQDSVDAMGDRLKAAGISPARVDAAILGWYRVMRDAGEIPQHGRQILLLMAGAVPEVIALEDGVPVAFRGLIGLEGVDEDAFAAETAREVAHTFASMELEHGQRAVSGIVVWTRAGEHGRLVEALKRECECSVSAKLLSAIPTVCEGLARRGAEDGVIDLTPEEWRIRERSRQFRRNMILSAAVLAGLWLLMTAGFWGALQVQREQVKRLARERDGLLQQAMEVRKLRRRVYMIRQYMGDKVSALESLREISELLPQGIDLTSLRFRKGIGVKVSAEASSVGLVYDFKNRLDASRVFGVTELDGPREYKGRQVFDIDINIEAPEGGDL